MLTALFWLALVIVALVLLGGGVYLGSRALADARSDTDNEVRASEAPVGQVVIEPDPPPTIEPTSPPTIERTAPPTVARTSLPIVERTPSPIVDVTPSIREPVIAGTEAAVRERAQERFLARTQNQLRDLEPVPDVWPEGPYLAMPSDYPEVVDVWQGYLSAIRRVRSADAERYRSAYEAALDDAGIEGETRSSRLAAAMSDFVKSMSLREAHYGRVEALAIAAIRSHDALLEAEGLILFDPSGSTGLTTRIGRGTSARDGESQMLLDQVVSLLEGALEADGAGPRPGETVREWVWDGFLDAATR